MTIQTLSVNPRDFTSQIGLFWSLQWYFIPLKQTFLECKQRNLISLPWTKETVFENCFPKGATPSSVQGSLPALCSMITPVDTWEPYGMLYIKYMSAMYKVANHLPISSPSPYTSVGDFWERGPPSPTEFNTFWLGRIRPAGGYPIKEYIHSERERDRNRETERHRQIYRHTEKKFPRWKLEVKKVSESWVGQTQNTHYKIHSSEGT